MVKLDSISKYYSSGEERFAALDDVNLQLDEGDFTVIVGANGAGKSTLLHILSGHVFPDKGRVFLNGDDVTSLPEHRRSPWVARVFQNPLMGTSPGLTVLENFRLASLRTGSRTLRIGMNSSFRKAAAERIAELGMGLEKKLDQPMGTLSGGQRQALTILMGVMDDLSLLLLDEPTAALDPKSAGTVMQVTQQLIDKHKLTSVLITHDMKEAHRFGNRIIQLEAGKVIRDIRGEERLRLSVPDLMNWFI